MRIGDLESILRILFVISENYASIVQILAIGLENRLEAESNLCKFHTLQRDGSGKGPPLD